jgi:dipeptidyl aminopeptidase/acylaminoacyl peptidase
VFDLNYRGSTGFGCAYRRSLYPYWGSKDVTDAVRGAQFLAEQGRADPRRLLIRGSSAGGFTVLAAHAFHDVFAAGANYYGVSDMEALARDTHKFESRYLDRLVGPYPEMQAKYRDLSPIHRLEGFHRPLITFQGLDDKVVPPAQSEIIVNALKARGVPVAYLPFAGEQHGFRAADNIVQAYEAELYFYGRVLGFTPAGEPAPVEIANLP